jgi:hypothetical protein
MRRSSLCRHVSGRPVAPRPGPCCRRDDHASRAAHRGRAPPPARSGARPGRRGGVQAARAARVRRQRDHRPDPARGARDDRAGRRVRGVVRDDRRDLGADERLSARGGRPRGLRSRGRDHRRRVRPDGAGGVRGGRLPRERSLAVRERLRALGVAPRGSVRPRGAARYGPGGAQHALPRGRDARDRHLGHERAPRDGEPRHRGQRRLRPVGAELLVLRATPPRGRPRSSRWPGPRRKSAVRGPSFTRRWRGSRRRRRPAARRRSRGARSRASLRRTPRPKRRLRSISSTTPAARA